MLDSSSVFDSKEFPRPVLKERGPSIEYRIDREQRVVYVTLAGDVTVESLLSTRDIVVADANYDRSMAIWIECRVMTSMPSEKEIRELALQAVLSHASETHGRIAIVAMTARAYAAATRFELFTEAPAERLGVFTDPVAARAFLGI